MATNLDAIRVLIVADDPLARAGLATLFDGQPTIQIVGQAPLQNNLLTDVKLFEPDVILLDLGWDGSAMQSASDTPLLETLRELAHSEYPLLALLPDDEQAPAIWATGTHGMLLRDAPVANLTAALLALAQGLAVLDPLLTETLLPTVAPRLLEPLHDALTPRELEVLQLLAEGLANKAIALQLSISEHTVKYHVNAILGKLDAQSRTEAVVRATRLGLIVL